MTLTPNDIDKAARLAKLDITDDHRDDLLKELEQILGLVDQLNSVDTNNIKPLAHPLDQSQPLRHDTITENNQRDAFQQLAPEVQDGFYLVPKVIESE
ncbi:MAG: Asp-tRNA(Asn)/Glu-tRNA(Gln) amidotransferase subunit GatC [Coxiellaceae bacterium]|nr:Asp-tRNA(Asn)/Glu-tRNA(Gln) amidotransferase subunit GatC [Coxiellaceae bacterium]